MLDADARERIRKSIRETQETVAQTPVKPGTGAMLGHWEKDLINQNLGILGVLLSPSTSAWSSWGTPSSSWWTRRGRAGDGQKGR